eukprot:s8_g54.t1
MYVLERLVSNAALMRALMIPTSCLVYMSSSSWVILANQQLIKEDHWDTWLCPMGLEHPPPLIAGRLSVSYPPVAPTFPCCSTPVCLSQSPQTAAMTGVAPVTAESDAPKSAPWDTLNLFLTAFLLTLVVALCVAWLSVLPDGSYGCLEEMSKPEVKWYNSIMALGSSSLMVWHYLDSDPMLVRYTVLGRPEFPAVHREFMGLRRWSTFTAWSNFSCAVFFGCAAALGWSTVPPKSLCVVTQLLWELMFPLGFFVNIVVSFVLIPQIKKMRRRAQHCALRTVVQKEHQRRTLADLLSEEGWIPVNSLPENFAPHTPTGTPSLRPLVHKAFGRNTNVKRALAGEFCAAHPNGHAIAAPTCSQSVWEEHQCQACCQISLAPNARKHPWKKARHHARRCSAEPSQL